MKKKQKWAIALAPLFLIGCTEQIAPDEKPGTATSGDDVLFSITKNSSSQTRTVYQDNWDETTSQAIYWGNYVDNNAKDSINIYCPDNPGRGFAKYYIEKDETNPNVAATVVKTSDIGVQWGNKKPHTFYAFYPADKAGEKLLDGRSTIRATVDNNQSPVTYKHKANEEDWTKLTPITSFKAYVNEQYDTGTGATTPTAQTIYGMPDMNAAIMVARTTMNEEQYGSKVPLQFNVLADVLDLTFHGPVTPNALGGNEIGSTTGISKPFIKIQSVTIDVVNPVEGKSPAEYEMDHSVAISGSFNLNMSEDANAWTDDLSKKMVTKVSGTPSIRIATAIVEKEGTYYPTLFVRGQEATPVKLDQLRLRCFLIPGQIKPEAMGKLRVTLQTDCGDFYQMLENDPKTTFVSGEIYPVKFGRFHTRGAEFNPAVWISQLNPNIYLSELSIPGAWHAAQTNYQGNHTLHEMYNAGVRAFEVHTKNGPVLRKHGDMNTEFDLNTETENFEDPFVLSEDKTIKDITIDESTIIPNNDGSGDGEVDYYRHDGTTYTRSREVTGTATVTRTAKTTEYITVPKFWIRLYRTAEDPNDVNSTPLSQAIINLAEIMNPTGLMFLEVGMDGQTAIEKVPYRSKETKITKEKVTNATITRKQYATVSILPPYTITWHEVYSDWSAANSDFTNAETMPEETISTDNTPGTFTLPGPQAWGIAVRSCLERLATHSNNTTNKPILYSGDLTANTTIKDVQGQVIAKINTNNTENEAEYLYGTKTPTYALFSRWVAGSGEHPRTINLQWKAPVPPFIDDIEENGLHEGLRWCYTELDNIGNDITIRETAVREMNQVASGNYAGGRHRTFYETCLGGYTGGANTPSATDCQAVAKHMHPFVLNRLNDPTRQNVPMGLVFMNYVIPPTGEEETYKSSELIRAVINNNKAFLLHRKGEDATTADVKDNTNSSFSNNSNNPLK